MIFHIDSTFRNVDVYPLPSDFEIDVNGQPPASLQAKDVRSLYLSNNYCQYSFRWNGNTTSPLYQIENDSISAGIIPVSPFKCFFFESLVVIEEDYYVGLVVYDPSTGLSAVVIAYEPTTRIITLNQPIFSNQVVKPLSVFEMTHNLRYTSSIALTILLINPSYSLKNNLLILGSTKLVPSGEQTNSLFLARGINTNSIVQNLTQNWTRPIQSIVGQYRTVILKDLPSYHANDVFLVWKEKVVTLPVISNFIEIGAIQTYDIVVNAVGFRIGDVLYSQDDEPCRSPSSFRVTELLPDGRVARLRLVHPGQYTVPGMRVRLRTLEEPSPELVVRVIRSGFALVVEGQVADGVETTVQNHSFLGLLDLQTYKVLYFSISERRETFFYIDILYEDAVRLNDLYKNAQPFERVLFLLPYFSLYPNIVAPVVPFQNAVCYETKIVSISLPNLPVCGFDVLLSSVPFVFVTLFNVNSSNNESYNTLLSNNPNSLQASFVCPIANILNPDIVRYVVVRSPQSTVFKFTPRNSLRFRVTLPNGQVLRYTNRTVLYNQGTFCNDNPEISSCININDPLTTPPSPNEPSIYPYNSLNTISATFFF
ncbi:MAG: hypothetical protein FJ308_22350, partial [Planctomycetes bacterium]|nr:hypothetical protein [Planctomycetota bacterium]